MGRVMNWINIKQNKIFPRDLFLVSDGENVNVAFFNRINKQLV